jgi:hypothetical protein
MGFKDLAKKALGQTDYQKSQKAQRSADRVKLNQEIYEKRQEGYREGALSRAKQEGKREGASHSSGFSAGLGGRLNAISGSIGNTEKMFGFDKGVQLGGGLDFGLGGLGGSDRSESKPRQRATVIKTGGQTITIRSNEGGEMAERKKKSSGSPYGWMENTHNFFDRDE